MNTPRARRAAPGASSKRPGRDRPSRPRRPPAAPSPSGRGPHDHAELRERILAASIALIEEEGLGRLSMREVARRAGVTHQAPYHHFADREAILGELARQGFRMLTDGVERATSHCAPGIARLIAAGEAYLEFACSHPAHFRIMFRPELVNLENCPGAEAEGENAFAKMQSIVHEAVLAGLPARPSEEALVTFMWSAAHGLACLILDGPLAHKLPDTSREAQIHSVFAVLRGLLEASVAQHAER